MGPHSLLDERKAEGPAHQRAGRDHAYTPLFREAFAKRRCLIPATGFYEWQTRADGKQPYRFVRTDLEPFAFAGLWEFSRLGGEGTLSAAIIVGEPNPLVAGIHDRMPVMLMPEDYDRWLDPATTVNELRALLKLYDANLTKSYEVSRVVNSVKNDTEACIEPVRDQGAASDGAFPQQSVIASHPDCRKCSSLIVARPRASKRRPLC